MKNYKINKKRFIWNVCILCILILLVIGLVYDTVQSEQNKTSEIEIIEVTPTPTIEPTSTPKPTENPMPEYDIPLSKELQEYTYNICKKYKVEYETIIALMSNESDFRLDLVYRNSNGSKDYGIMQVNSSDIKEMEKHYKLGWIDFKITDIMNPKQNIEAGVYWFTYGYKEFKGDTHKALMANNFGIKGAYKVIKNGHETSRYSRRVMNKREQLFTKNTIE